eukprot:Em0020g962a
MQPSHSTTCRTALHWACKRGHKEIVTFLLQSGADANIVTHNGEKAVHLAGDPEVATLVKVSDQATLPASGNTQLPIVPNYLQSPPFPYVDVSSQIRSARETDGRIGFSLSPHSPHSPHLPLLTNSTASTYPATWDPLAASRHSAVSIVVKARVAGSDEQDFVEVPVVRPSFQTLVEACCEELELKASNVAKIRKLPDVLVRKDADVARLTDGERLELVLTTANSVLAPLQC